MIIDVYADIIKRFFSKSEATGLTSEIKGFLQGRFPNLTRVVDPRKVTSPQEIAYEADGVRYYFSEEGDAVLMATSSTSPTRAWIRFLPRKIQAWTVGMDGDMYEEIYEYPSTTKEGVMVDAQATVNYYDQEATDLLLQGRRAVDFSMEAEKNKLSLVPDASIQAQATPMMNFDDSKKWVSVTDCETNEQIQTFEANTSSFEALARAGLRERCLMNLSKSSSK